jgi:hypothetical protein
LPRRREQAPGRRAVAARSCRLEHGLDQLERLVEALPPLLDGTPTAS